MHALSEEFDATELWRARPRVTHLHIPVPAMTRGTLARTHEFKTLRKIAPGTILLCCIHLIAPDYVGRYNLFTIQQKLD